MMLLSYEKEKTDVREEVTFLYSTVGESYCFL